MTALEQAPDAYAELRGALAGAMHAPFPWVQDQVCFWIDAANVGDGNRVCDMRGWGYLTSGGLGLPHLSNFEGLAVQKARSDLILTAANSASSLLAERDGLAAENARLRTALTAFVGAGGTSPRMGITQFSSWSLTKLADAFDLAVKALAPVSKGGEE